MVPGIGKSRDGLLDQGAMLARHGYVTLAPEPAEPDALKRRDSLKAPDPLNAEDPLRADDPLKPTPRPPDPADEELDLDAMLAGIVPGPPERAGHLAETRALFEDRGWGSPAEVSEIAIRPAVAPDVGIDPDEPVESLLLELDLDYDTIAEECGYPSPDAARMAIRRALAQVCKKM